MDSRLVRLVPAGDYFLLSGPERRLLKFALDLLGEEVAETKLSFYDAEARFVSGYAFYNEEKDGEYKRVANRVDFASEFVEELRHRALFAVDWSRVSGITREAFS